MVSEWCGQLFFVRPRNTALCCLRVAATTVTDVDEKDDDETVCVYLWCVCVCVCVCVFMCDFLGIYLYISHLDRCRKKFVSASRNGHVVYVVGSHFFCSVSLG
jgi:hypothetical protein